MMIDEWLIANVRAKLQEDIERFKSLPPDEDPLLNKGRESSILALQYALSMLDNLETARVPQPLSVRQQLRRLRDVITEAAASGLDEIAWWLRDQKETPRYYRD